MWRRIWTGAIAAIALAGMSLGTAQANDGMPNDSGWAFKGGLYGWAMWLQGTNTVRDQTFDVYADPIDIIDAIDGPIIMGNFEATRGPFSFFADIIYAELGFGADFLTETRPIPALNVTAGGGSQTQYNFGVYEFGMFYELGQIPSAHGSTAVELGVGARFVENDIRIKGAIDLNATLELRKLTDRLEDRIRLIEDREVKVEALTRLNRLREQLVENRIVHAEDKGRDRRVARLERTLGKVDRRGQALKAIRALQELQLAALERALRLDGQEFNRQFAFLNSGDMNWEDPTIALRVTHDFGNGRSVTAWGDFGGFNTDDGRSWKALLTYDIEGTLFGYETTTSLGYKALWLEFEERTSRGTRGMDVVLHGPVGELKFRW